MFCMYYENIGVSGVAKGSRFDIFNEYEPFNFNFVLLFIEKDISHHN